VRGRGEQRKCGGVMNLVEVRKGEEVILLTQNGCEAEENVTSLQSWRQIKKKVRKGRGPDGK